MLPILLASSSPYRRELLERLRLPFACHSPAIDETPHPNESAGTLVERLSIAKAQALADSHPQHLIIGSDQVATHKGQIIGKPHTFERAFEQLQATSGSSVTFLTGLALLNSISGAYQVATVPFTVHFRTLSNEQIERYLKAERPYDCAGSFKAEGLGISLFRATTGEDASSLIGLPLIRLIDMLHNEGIVLP